ncbi:MAG: RNB domain-containing ribonuclease [Candidatus Promineifilaceae bacterium]
MPTLPLYRESLVLYKNQPARVLRIDSKKVAIEIEGGKTLSVRYKDVVPLHPGPLVDLADLQPRDGELLTAWELLTGESTDISELAELIFGEYTPSTAWASWQLVKDGLYFKGEPQNISVRTKEEIEREKEIRDQKIAEAQAWQAFITRVEQGKHLEADAIYLEEVAKLALGEQDGSRVLRTLKLTESPERAHAFLLTIGYWDPLVNPYPVRSQLPIISPQMPMSLPADEDRRDLTHLVSLAIDDEGSSDPDDALSVEDGRLWVHIADVAAIVRPNSPVDLEARARGANLYLPEGTVTMLPSQATRSLGLGLSDISPALSFGLDLSDKGEILELEIVPSWVRVTRLTYDEVESRLSEPVFRKLDQYAMMSRAQRIENGAIELYLPEVRIRVVDGKVDIRPLPPLRSRELVREAMLMTGEAVARYAIDNEIPVPFTSQERPDSVEQAGKALSKMYALRNLLRPSRKTSQPSPHGGLGVDVYTQATSPLRRYLDLVVHQQLRAHLSGSDLESTEAITERIGAVEEVTRSIRRAERNSNQHWTLVYLMQNPGWRGDGVIVDRRGTRNHCLIPELAFETSLYLRKEVGLDSEFGLQVEGVDLAHLEADFRPVD